MADTNPLRNEAPRDALGTTWPDEALRRFNSMAVNLGLFDSGKHGIDHWVKENRFVRAMVSQYIEAITANATIGAWTPPSTLCVCELKQQY